MKRCKVQKLLCTRPASKPPLMLFKSVHSLSLSTFSSQKKTLSFSNHRIGSLRALDAHSHRYRLSLWYSSMITRCQDCSDPYRRDERVCSEKVGTDAIGFSEIQYEVESVRSLQVIAHC
ncbi:uncharacterized protein LOC107422446 [Ziziphus jujuba]|uniref:Uncharacterized protein LOC107422446 n=1 Tax=Ziziphus jujuba TaxID=326968 RepID=A0ABM4A8Q2_ZIZJJ|nr:uncharacterized protein LOC107422446 [Ziziphus jujuba]